MIDALQLLGGALSVLAVATMVVLVARRVALSRTERRRAALEHELTPLALELVDGEEPELGRLSAAQERALAAILGRYARKLRGEPRDRIAAFFEERGAVRRELGQLRSRRSAKRATAAFALGDMGALSTVDALIGALDDRARDVRSAAARSLGMLEAEAAVPRLVESLAGSEVPRAIAGGALLAMGSKAAPGLRSLLDAPDPGVRANAIELLGFTGDATDADALDKALREDHAIAASSWGEHAEVRAAAARALGRIGTRRAAAGLRGALNDPAPFVRTAAAHALGRIGDRDAFDALVRQASDDMYDPAQAAAQALAAIDPMKAMRLGGVEGASAHLAEAAALAELEPA
ncbi:HEAT repeat domain-containing protein [Solirubrobacter sp. CPCC 204708]|uniref:HEAT repeat domain-containing protein n=1 Tax=Solirubrobacter deserti TaxID=2282478 RepID=A0ABT4RCW8_9ACTN|nr:HEAT repeat domain-containing protein [Solirubrobacter deserti]MBE2315597.1 HEAT repeat domain-containing protein [Solirubrobacter deserti]MDA0136236.1 HEAT repeat domain-containing protein [Solirubrobacter deserti]